MLDRYLEARTLYEAQRLHARHALLFDALDGLILKNLSMDKAVNMDVRTCSDIYGLLERDFLYLVASRIILTDIIADALTYTGEITDSTSCVALLNWRIFSWSAQIAAWMTVRGPVRVAMLLL